MKYVIVVGDGMADEPLDELGGKTPLEVAEHPNMDRVASKGYCGFLDTQPQELEEGTDVALLYILGYEPKNIRIGRGALEAAGMGLDLKDDELAFRCNLITTENGVLKDYSAGHISSDEAKELIRSVDEAPFKPPDVRFYSGVSFRHILVLKGKHYSENVICSPPHDHMGKPISSLLVKGIDKNGSRTADILNHLILSSEKVLSKHPVNLRRIREGKSPANMIWPWGQGRKPNLPTLQDLYGLKGAVIAAVDVIKGLGAYAGLEIVRVPGATGFYDTNYEGKADYALESLKHGDIVLVHVEAPDEASHVGDARLKVKTIEDLDKRLLGRILDKLGEDYTIAVLSDHTTSTKLRTHIRTPVPFAIYSTKQDRVRPSKRFDEASIRSVAKEPLEGSRFFPLFLRI